jgi:hypothetical protein
LEEHKSVCIDKKYLKAISLESMLHKCDRFQDTLKTVNQKKDYSVKLTTKSNGYYFFEEKINEMEGILYQYFNSSESSIVTYKSLRFKYKKIEFALTFFNKYFYYKNGNLKFTSHSVEGTIFEDTNIGKAKTYNQKGKVIKKINYDKHFKFNLLDIIKIGYDNFQMDENVEMYISRSFNDKEAYWLIMYRLPNDYDDPAFSKIISINDKTKEIKDEYYIDVEKYRYKEYQYNLNKIDK